MRRHPGRDNEQPTNEYRVAGFWFVIFAEARQIWRDVLADLRAKDETAWIAVLLFSVLSFAAAVVMFVLAGIAYSRGE